MRKFFLFFNIEQLSHLPRSSPGLVAEKKRVIAAA